MNTPELNVSEIIDVQMVNGRPDLVFSGEPPKGKTTMQMAMVRGLSRFRKDPAKTAMIQTVLEEHEKMMDSVWAKRQADALAARAQ